MQLSSMHGRGDRRCITPARARPVWQLTVVPFHVFYDVDEEHGEVIVNAVRKKLPGKTTEEIL